jgi:hypothetical protein
LSYGDYTHEIACGFCIEIEMLRDDGDNGVKEESFVVLFVQREKWKGNGLYAFLKSHLVNSKKSLLLVPFVIYSLVYNLFRLLPLIISQKSQKPLCLQI